MRSTLVALTALLCLGPSGVLAGPLKQLKERGKLDEVNSEIGGRVHDFTDNHGVDNRVYSPSLCKKRELYVYTPPCFRRDTAYPFIMYLHGLNQDEQSFLDVAPLFDEGIRKGIMPPCVIAAPDGTINGDPAMFGSGSFYLNSDAGRFEDWIMKDVWCFCMRNFPLRPERGCHGMVGASMGGFGVYNLSIKYRNDVSIVAGILPALDLRYQNCHHSARTNFNPECYDPIDRLKPMQNIACIANIMPIPRYLLVQPLYPIEPETVNLLAKESPVEMLTRYNVQPGELRMFIGYAGKDDFNLDAQAESFLYRARRRCLSVEVVEVPNGKHRVSVGMEMAPAMIRFMGRSLRLNCGGDCCETPVAEGPAEERIPTAVEADPAPAPVVSGEAAATTAEEDGELLWVEPAGPEVVKTQR